MSRPWAAVLVGIAFFVAMYVWVGLTEFPAVVVCDRGRPNVEVSSTLRGGYFAKHRIGPCATYTHKSRPVAGPSGDSRGGD